MLLTENCNNAFDFVKFVVQNIVDPDTVKTAFLMTSQLRQLTLTLFLLQASLSFSGAVIGPCLGMFLLGAVFPFANSWVSLSFQIE